MTGGKIITRYQVGCGRCRISTEIWYRADGTLADFKDYLRACLWVEDSVSGWVCADCQ